MVLPPLQAILDVEAADAAGWRPRDLAAAFLDGGARFLQIRGKRLQSGPLLDLCDAVVALARTAGALVVVNDRADLARLSGADGVHVGQRDLPPEAVRAILGPGAIVGVSTHSVAELEGALRAPLSYVAVGPVFGTRTKDTGHEAVGLDLVRIAAERSGGTPVVAIGGITVDSARSVIEAGASSVAVISDLLSGGDPSERIRQFCRRLG